MAKKQCTCTKCSKEELGTKFKKASEELDEYAQNPAESDTQYAIRLQFLKLRDKAVELASHSPLPVGLVFAAGIGSEGGKTLAGTVSGAGNKKIIATVIAELLTNEPELHGMVVAKLADHIIDELPKGKAKSTPKSEASDEKAFEKFLELLQSISEM